MEGHAQNDQNSQKSSKLQKNANFVNFELVYLSEKWLDILFRIVSYCIEHNDCIIGSLGINVEKCCQVM